jgi:polyisoprenoid-binding protein YceI
VEAAHRVAGVQDVANREMQVMHVAPTERCRTVLGTAAAIARAMTTTHRLLFVALTVLSGGIGSTSLGQPKPDKPASPPLHSTFQVDAKKSRFIVETQTTGLSAMFAHDHKIEVRNFTGQATFTRAEGRGASLDLTVQANSLYLLGENEIGARQSIESVLREDVLETAKYPEIVFKTRSVTSERRGDGTFDVRLVGELNLHGVKRAITIPVRASLEGQTLHAIGVFELRQTDFNITPFSFVSGSVGIKDVVTLSFDIVATQIHG